MFEFEGTIPPLVTFYVREYAPLTLRFQVHILCSATRVFGNCKSVLAQSNQESKWV